MGKNDGSITFVVDIDDKDAQKELAKLKKDVAGTEQEISRMEAKKSPLTAQAEQLRQSIKKAREEAKRYRDQWIGGVTGADKSEAAATARAGALEEEYAGVVKQIEKIDEKLLPAYQKLDGMKDRAGELEKQLAEAGKGAGKMSPALERAQKSAQKFQLRLREVVRSALVFTVITQALAAFRKWVGAVIETDKEAVAAIAQLKGALLTLVQPLVQGLIPAFTALVRLLTEAASRLSALTSKMFGQTAAQASAAAEALYAQTEALEGTGSAAKKAAKSLAGFDEINQLSSSDSAADSTAIQPDFSGVKAAMSEMEIYMSGAMLAIGALLTFSGANIPLGLGLMAIGATGLASALTVNWETMPQTVSTALAQTLGVLGGGMLAIGAVLAFSGSNLPLGIALMAAGAAALVTAAAVNWDSIVEVLKGPVGKVTAVLSGSLLALGAIVAFGGYLPVGIAMMAAGAAGLVTVAALNWNSITEALKWPIGQATALASGALLALGLILLFSGAGTGLGIGMLLAGGAGLAAVAAVNWDFILDKVKDVWRGVTEYWNTNIAPIFTIEWWANLAKKCGQGLINGFYGAINSVRAAFEGMINVIVDALNQIQITVPDWIPRIGGETYGFSFDHVSFPPLDIPQLATGAVIPPNREFLAVLGDQRSGNNIEAPESLIRKIVREEAGGMNTQLLQEILQAIKDGGVIMLDGQKVSKRVVHHINNMTAAAGESVLLL